MVLKSVKKGVAKTYYNSRSDSFATPCFYLSFGSSVFFVFSAVRCLFPFVVAYVPLSTSEGFRESPPKPKVVVSGGREDCGSQNDKRAAG